MNEYTKRSVDLTAGSALASWGRSARFGRFFRFDFLAPRAWSGA